MKRLLITITLVLGICCGSALQPASAQPTGTGPITALILYDAPPNDSYSKLGQAYAIMLSNLLGHFDGTVTLKPVDQYTPGMVENYQTIFYVGAYYDNPGVPTAFLSDVTTTQKTIVWFKYNLWQVAWNATYSFTQRYGISFSGLRGLDSSPSSSNPAPGFFDTVIYKNTNLVKYYDFNASTGVVRADPDIGVTQVTDATKAQVLVNIKDSKTNEQVPYIIRSGNFWYVADMPFSFIGPRDRYLVLCDMLFSMVNRAGTAGHQALVRLEDVGALVSTSTMKTLTDYLFGLAIPFSIATIPHYRDPLGIYNGGVAQDIPFAQATGLKSALAYASARGAKIVMHGYTHQYKSMRNVNTAVSGDDFEFWNAVANTPVAEDSTQWAGGRLDSGLQELISGGYTPFAWEAPHYQSSPLSIKAVPPRFANTYQRVVYYTSDNPTTLNSAAINRDFSVGQFFPYLIKKDYYGQKVIPENLGNIEYNICNIDPSSCLTYTWQDIYLNAQYALLVQDAVASFFFHPFWLESAVGTPGFADFKSLIQGITQLGYTWADASTF
ncbi:papd-like protein [Cupriavidus sp. SK-3]|uniref:DUF2334 domain-containing protein n=1 Tax=Cupriavidus sp. SK-3 TaxID=1470558 RepID=UPI0004503613|nr:DUF2334 domain-containing protein [Cupriavidus sp. SK-3]KDP89492.1 papd-like protein [Cupriavidus sp. SK-3]